MDLDPMMQMPKDLKGLEVQFWHVLRRYNGPGDHLAGLPQLVVLVENKRKIHVENHGIWVNISHLLFATVLTCRSAQQRWSVQRKAQDKAYDYKLAGLLDQPKLQMQSLLNCFWSRVTAVCEPRLIRKRKANETQYGKVTLATLTLSCSTTLIFGRDKRFGACRANGKTIETTQ